MLLGLFTALHLDRSLEESLDAAAALGLDAVELPVGSPHLPLSLVDDEAGVRALRASIERRGLRVSALSCHGNPIHPVSAQAAVDHGRLRAAMQLAPLLGTDRLTLFSGCPGDSGGSAYPNWVTCAWPTEFRELLEWQWQERVVPYWREQATDAATRGLHLAFEMHPGFVVYNPSTLLRLREACGEAIGANLDPSHLFWQGIDVLAAIGVLGRAGAIFHVHAKDTGIYQPVASVDGVLDTRPLGDVASRAWVFRTVGWGHDALFWREFATALRRVGYDDVLSIEHEDAYLSIDEGLRQAVTFLKGILPRDPAPTPWWA
jgi:sugar phosphate isomerase/epimerase